MINLDDKESEFIRSLTVDEEETKIFSYLQTAIKRDILMREHFQDSSEKTDKLEANIKKLGRKLNFLANTGRNLFEKKNECIQQLENDLREKENAIEKLNKKIKEETSNNSTIIERLTNKNETQKKQIDSLKIENENIKNELDKSNDKIKNLNQELENKSTTISSIEQELDESQQNFSKEQKKNNYLEKNISSLKEQHQELNSEYVILKENNDKITKKLDSLKKKYKSKSEEFVDLVNNLSNNINKENTYSLTIPKLFLSKEITYEIIKEIPKKKEFYQVGIIGYKQSGKTFTMNKLLDLKRVHYNSTSGIGINFENEIVVFDSEGILNEVDKLIIEKKKMKKNKIQDISSQEKFINDFLIETCSVIIIVMELLSNESIKYMNYISKKLPPKKQMIVIHNLKNIYSFKEFNETIRDKIEVILDCEKISLDEKNNVCYYVEKEINNEIKRVSHFIIGQDFGECESHNEFIFKHLRDKIFQSPLKPFNPITDLIKFFNSNYSRYIFSENDDAEFSLIKTKSENKNIRILKVDPEGFSIKKIETASEFDKKK